MTIAPTTRHAAMGATTFQAEKPVRFFCGWPGESTAGSPACRFARLRAFACHEGGIGDAGRCSSAHLALGRCDLGRLGPEGPALDRRGLLEVFLSSEQSGQHAFFLLRRGCHLLVSSANLLIHGIDLP